jgi:hypothetical protein
LIPATPKPARKPPGTWLINPDQESGAQGASGSAPVLPGGEAAQCSQEVDLAERGPVGIAEVQFGVHALPAHEAGDALLTAGADDQVGIGLPGCVQVPGDVVGGEDFGEPGERTAAFCRWRTPGSPLRPLFSARAVLPGSTSSVPAVMDLPGGLRPGQPAHDDVLDVLGSVPVGSVAPDSSLRSLREYRP